MNATARFDPATPVRDILARYPQLSSALAAHGLDTCCGGEHPLRDACRAKGVPLDEVLQDLESAWQAVEAHSIVPPTMSIREMTRRFPGNPAGARAVRPRRLRRSRGAGGAAGVVRHRSPAAARRLSPRRARGRRHRRRGGAAGALREARGPLLAPLRRRLDVSDADPRRDDRDDQPPADRRRGRGADRSPPDPRAHAGPGLRGSLPDGHRVPRAAADPRDPVRRGPASRHPRELLAHVLRRHPPQRRAAVRLSRLGPADLARLGRHGARVGRAFRPVRLFAARRASGKASTTGRTRSSGSSAREPSASPRPWRSLRRRASGSPATSTRSFPRRSTSPSTSSPSTGSSSPGSTASGTGWSRSSSASARPVRGAATVTLSTQMAGVLLYSAGWLPGLADPAALALRDAGLGLAAVSALVFLCGNGFLWRRSDLPDAPHARGSDLRDPRAHSPASGSGRSSSSRPSSSRASRPCRPRTSGGPTRRGTSSRSGS